MRIITATTVLKMPFNGISSLLSAFPESSFAEAMEDESKHPASAAEPLYAATRASKQAFIYNKALLQSDRNPSGQQFHSFQTTDSLCLEKLYQSNFLAANSSNGSSRLFVFLWCGTFEMPEDKLVPNAVIILGRPDEAAKSLKASLVASCKYPVVFNEFESFFHYRKQLKKIINSKPRCVILIPAGKYADLNISLANFESLIREEAEMLRDNIVPFAFILSKEDTGNKKVTQFNAAIEELCNLRSFHLVSDGSDIKKLFFLIPNQNY